MTPAARIAAAIEILDAWRAGEPAEKALTGWARGHRFAGSKDRAAIRDHVFDALRRARSTAWLGGAETGRGHMIGLLRQQGLDPRDYFNGEGYAPDPIGENEEQPSGEPTEAVRLDWPDWLMSETRRSLGDETDAVLEVMRHRAPITLRVNLAKSDVDAARAALAAEGIETLANPLAASALDVTSGARRIAQSRAYQDGLVELQDAASQAVVARIDAPLDATVLDFCAGGGGKTLALAARGFEHVTAHDADPSRMTDLPARAARAGAAVRLAKSGDLTTAYDVILTDVPCSGSGSWRRAPDAKWRLTEDRLADLTRIQDGILDQCAARLSGGGTLVYATCSILRCENRDRVDAFLTRHADWECVLQKSFLPTEGGDGFFTAHLKQR